MTVFLIQFDTDFYFQRKDPKGDMFWVYRKIVKVTSWN
jgi:hypothetical protein